MAVDRRPKHRQQLQKLSASLVGNTKPLKVKKRTVSNLFRYDKRKNGAGREVDLRSFNKPLYIDTKHKTLEVQGLTTFEQIVDFTLQYSLVPIITPELKHITIGGAVVGIGIETNSFRYGFVHDNLLEADVLLADGRIVTCRPEGDHQDLFYGLANSYGTLGYVLRAKIQLRPVKKYVKLTTIQPRTTKQLVDAMKKAASNAKIDYIESLLYSKKELYLTTGIQTNSAKAVTSIYGKTIFYRTISQPGEVWLPIKDYLFRYDPEWFWALSDDSAYDTFRQFAPTWIRSSAFYSRYLYWQEKFGFSKPHDNLEKLIQDWEVPWTHATGLINYALDNLDLNDKPLMCAPTKTLHKNTLYPMPVNKLFLNLGSYSFVVRQKDDEPYHSTKIMDTYTFEHQGIKMLYSSTFLDEKSFNKIYGGKTYKLLKKKYDPKQLLPTLYQKAVKNK